MIWIRLTIAVVAIAMFATMLASAQDGNPTPQAGAPGTASPFQCVMGKKGKIPNPFNCEEYYNCPGNSTEGTPKTCKTGKQFSATLGKCVNTTAANCTACAQGATVTILSDGKSYNCSKLATANPATPQTSNLAAAPAPAEPAAPTSTEPAPPAQNDTATEPAPAPTGG